MVRTSSYLKWGSGGWTYLASAVDLPARSESAAGDIEDTAVQKRIAMSAYMRGARSMRSIIYFSVDDGTRRAWRGAGMDLRSNRHSDRSTRVTVMYYDQPLTVAALFANAVTHRAA